MKPIRLGLTVLAAFGAFGVVTAQAATITVETTNVTAVAEIEGGQKRDTSSPVATINNTQTFGGQFIDTVTSDATQSESGYSSVEVNVKHEGSDATAANGSQDKIDAAAYAVRTVKFTNTGTTAANLGTFDFRISGVELEVFNGGGGPIDPMAGVFFTASATSNSALLDSFDAQMDLTGAYNDFQIENAKGFGGTVQRLECYMDTCLRGKVNVDVLTGSLNLGIIQAGDSVTVLTTLGVNMSFNGTELGARAKAVDPNGGSYYSYSFDPGPTPVPLPAAGWMLISALGGIVALRRRKQA